MDDVETIASALGQEYVQFVPPAWVATLSRMGRSVCSVRLQDSGEYEAICNTTSVTVPFQHDEDRPANPVALAEVALQLWSLARQR